MMQLKTILNRVEHFKSFVYRTVRWDENAARPTIEVQIEPRRNGRPICSGCDRAGPGYDRLPQRRRRQEPIDHHVSLVSGSMGEAAFVAGSRPCFPYHLGQRISLGKTCGFPGYGPSPPGRYRGGRR